MAKEEDKKVDQAAGEDGDAPKKSRKMLFIIVGGVVAVAAIGGGAAFFLMGSSDANMSAKTPTAEDSAAAAQAKAGDGEEQVPAEPAAEAAAATKDGSSDAKPKSAAEALSGAPQVDIDFGCTMPLKPFHLNLGNPLENRFMRLEVSVEYPCNNATEQEINRRMPQLRDAVVSVASRKTREFLLSPDGKDQLRLELLNRVNHYMSRNVENVFITDILIE